MMGCSSIAVEWRKCGGRSGVTAAMVDAGQLLRYTGVTATNKKCWLMVYGSILVKWGNGGKSGVTA